MNDVAAWLLLRELRAGDLADGATEFLRVCEVDGFNSGDGLGGDGVGIELRVHGDARQDTELGSGIEAVDVRGGVGLGVTKLLRIGENRSVFSTSLHAAEDVVTSAVDDAAEARDLVSAETL